MAEYRLHGFAESGNTYKVAMMLAACGADWEAVFVPPPQLGDPAWRATYNETGEIPVLEHAGEMHVQSAVVLDYLAERLGKYGWANDDERRAVQRWLYFDNHKFTGPCGFARFRRLIMQIDDAATADYQSRFETSLAIMEKHFGANDWVALGRTTIADISLAGYMFFDGEIAVDWKDYPNMSAWLGRIQELPGWKGPYDMLPRAHPPEA